VPLISDEEDVLGELVNIGVGRAAATLSELIGTRIELSVPRTTLLLSGKLADFDPGEDGPSLAVVQDFSGLFAGRSALLFPRSSGLRLAQILGEIDGPVDELDPELSGILTEVGNIMLNGVLGSVANILETRFDYSVPRFFAEPPRDLALIGPLRGVPALLLADARFLVRESDIRGSLLIALDRADIDTIFRIAFTTWGGNGVRHEYPTRPSCATDIASALDPSEEAPDARYRHRV
jgi:chemotaxis protein CheC